MDVRITGAISGLELTRRLRKNQRTQAAGIIVLTTVSRPQDADVALKAGANRFLEKPVPAPILRAEIARLLAGSRELFSESRDRRHRANAAGAPPSRRCEIHRAPHEPMRVPVVSLERHLSRALARPHLRLCVGNS
jgi:DNA-binding response OmpR family regulator